MKVLDLKSNQLLATVKLSPTPFAVAVNPWTNRVYVSQENGVEVVDGATNKLLTSLPYPTARPLAVDAEGHRLFVSLASGGIVVLDAVTYAVLARLPGYASGAMNSKTNLLYTIQPSSHQVLALDANSFAIRHTITLDAPRIRGMDGPSSVAVNERTNRIYVSECEVSDRVRVVDGDTHKVIATVKVGRIAKTLAVNPQTNRIFVGGDGDLRLYVIDGATNQVIAAPECDDCATPLVVPSLSAVFVSVGDLVVVCKESPGANR